MAVAEHWDCLRHDSAWSTVLWIAEWPRIDVTADFLHPLVFAAGVRRVLTIIARPLPTDAALRQIRKEKTEAVADMAQKQKVGQIADLSDAQEYEDLIARERSVVAGHTDVEFSGFVTVTAPTRPALDAAREAITRAAAQAACEVRPLYGRQAQAFVLAALPSPGPPSDVPLGKRTSRRRTRPVVVSRPGRGPTGWAAAAPTTAAGHRGDSVGAAGAAVDRSPGGAPLGGDVETVEGPLVPLPPDDDGTVHGVSGYIPPGVSARKAALAARRIEVDHRRQVLEARRADLRAGRDEARSAGYLPAHGQPGPMAGRSYRRLRVTPHRATSEVLAGAYPFLAEEGLGAEGALIGQDAWSGTAFCFDPWELYRRGALTNPNMFLAGQIGRGKSTLAKALATRYIAFGRRVYVPGDPKGEWTVVTRAVGGQVVELGVGQTARLNPLDDGPRPSGVTDDAWRSQVVQRRMSLLAALAESTLGRPLGPVERTALDAALATAVDGAATPVLPMVVDALHTPSGGYAGSTATQLVDDGRQVAHALGRLVRGDLAGLFDGPSTVRLDPTLPMLSLDLSHISGSDTLIGLVMTCTASWLEAALADPAGGQRLVVYDEAWRLLAQPSLLARMQAQWKLSRAWGLANLMVVHRLSDLEAAGDAGSETRGLAQGLLGDTATRILYNEPTDEALAAGKVLGLSSTETEQLPDLAQGEGLWRVNERAFVVRHICTPAELAMFDTNARMVEGRRRQAGSAPA